MKVTKYPQSCLLLEKDGSRLLVDPGVLVAQKFPAEALAPVDGILITHEHYDHADPEFIRALTAGADVPVVANAGAKNALGDVVTKVVADGERFQIGAFAVAAHELPHVDMEDGSPGPHNTGYLIDDMLFTPGDGVRAEGVRADILAMPLAGPDISPRDGFDLLRQVGARTVIPVHYDVFLADPEQIAGRAANIAPDVKFMVLRPGDSAEF